MKDAACHRVGVQAMEELMVQATREGSVEDIPIMSMMCAQLVDSWACLTLVKVSIDRL